MEWRDAGAFLGALAIAAGSLGFDEAGTYLVLACVICFAIQQLHE